MECVELQLRSTILKLLARTRLYHCSCPVGRQSIKSNLLHLNQRQFQWLYYRLKNSKLIAPREFWSLSRLVNRSFQKLQQCLRWGILLADCELWSPIQLSAKCLGSLQRAHRNSHLCRGQQRWLILFLIVSSRSILPARHLLLANIVLPPGQFQIWSHSRPTLPGCLLLQSMNNLFRHTSYLGSQWIPKNQMV